MFALRKLLYKPKKTDQALLAQFYYADEDLSLITAELDTLDGRKQPAKCAALVAQLRQHQDFMLKLIQSMMEETITDERAPRDFRVKYPDELLQDELAGQLWFGAECLAAGSSILYREVESDSMRPLAKLLTKQIEQLRFLLRDQCLKDPLQYSDKIRQTFVKFDKTFADFELSYVSAMVPVKSMKEYDMAQDITVLFSETVNRAINKSLISRDMIDYYDPALMFTIPRLAIVCGLIIYPEGPLNPDSKSKDMSELFRPFQGLLRRIRELLWTLNQDELKRLEKLLCNLEETVIPSTSNDLISLPKKKGGKASKGKRAGQTTSQHASSLFNDIESLSNVVNQTAYNQTTRDPPGSTSENQTYPVDFPNAVTINNEETGVARIVFSASNAPPNRTAEPTSTDLDNSTRHQLDRPATTSSTGENADFAFSLPLGGSNRNIILNRNLSQEVTNSQEHSHPDYNRNTEDGNTSDSGDSTESAFSSDSESSVSSHEMRRYEQVLLNDTLSSHADTVRSRYRSSEELLQKLFVCVSGVADQLQTNFASDLRNILKSVFELHASSDIEVSKKIDTMWPAIGNQSHLESPPEWIPDSQMDRCCSCKLPFTFIRRRHHCRNCGLIFCSRCSSNSAPLPNYGFEKAVRICNKCYMYRINPFYMDEIDQGRSSYNSAAFNSTSPN